MPDDLHTSELKLLLPRVDFDNPADVTRAANAVLWSACQAKERERTVLGAVAAALGRKLSRILCRRKI